MEMLRENPEIPCKITRKLFIIGLSPNICAETTKSVINRFDVCAGVESICQTNILYGKQVEQNSYFRVNCANPLNCAHTSIQLFG